MVTKKRAQIGFDEKIIENPDLLRTLEERQELKLSVSEFRKTDKSAKEQIDKITDEPPFRVGRFLITKQDTPAKEVSFQTDLSSHITIKLAGEE